MRVYVSGPMSGYPEDNFPAFYEAANQLAAAGYVPINPAEGSRPAAGGDPQFNGTPEYQEIMARAMVLLRDAEGICMLPGWRDSRGACAEHQQAWMRGLQIGTIDEWLEWGIARCIRWVGNPEYAPRKCYPGDAGFDLVVSETMTLQPGRFLDVPLGIAVQLPESTWGLLCGRSSALRRRGILVTQGIIDQGYRGPLFAGCQNLGSAEVQLNEGERIAQLIPMKLEAESIGLTSVPNLSESVRGTAGFGSSGI